MDGNLREKLDKTLNEAKKIIYGQDELLESIVAAIVCQGHVLIEGMPGLGKTKSVATMSKLCELNFNRIQFTPDLLPSDLIGTMVYSPSTENFKTKFGPIFTQILLADEINRSPAKVQSALLEAMEEKQVTIGETSHKLSRPFVVLATQNPIEQEGTYPLPEAQLDRFMIKIHVTYPDFESEKKILDLKEEMISDLESIFSIDDFEALKNEMDNIYVDEKIKDIVVRIVQATRPQDPNFIKDYSGAIIAGASPRASIWIYRYAIFKAYMDNKDYVTPDHILAAIPNVLGHRIILSYEAIMDKLNIRELSVNLAKAYL